MRRIVIEVPQNATKEYLAKVLQECQYRGDAPICLPHTKASKEWHYAAQAMVIYCDGDLSFGTNDAVEHALHIGLPIERRHLGAAQDSQDA